ncbi:hypothetical protein CBS101457_001516 [Exobasidium rhododendri]|nr:hypothetical protein CBS101457_001516 [Exobasidium rhododendri]
MPPSWLRHLGETPSKVPADLENADWSGGLGIGSSNANAPIFSEGLLSASNVALQGEICAFAVEPMLGYIAVGTTTGSIHLFGKPSVSISWTLRPANKVRHLLFKSGSPLLIAIDDRDNLSIFDLSRNDPQIRAKASATTNPFLPSQSTTTGSGPSNPTHTDTPMRVGAHSARNSVICIEVSPLHNHLFLGLRDGTIDTFDLERFTSSPYRVPNLWWEEEEILRRSGVPDAPNRRHVPLIIDMKSHPKDLNQMLLGYEGGVILLDVKQKTVLKTYQLRHLPGVVGSGVGHPDLIWTERSCPATCIAWRPDGLVFACGHEDGCISFWDVLDDSKPVMVRTLELLDVDRPVGVPDNIVGGPARSREPIFKLAWSGFPEQSWLDLAANATSKVQQQQYQQSHAAQQDLTSGSILTVLGGATERQPPGLVCFHMPPFAWSYASYWNSKTPEAAHKARQALKASLDTTLESRYSTPSAVEDFLLIPKNNPYYGLTFDPTSIIILESADPLLPPLPPPAATRGLSAFTFPPPSSSSATLMSTPQPGIQYTFAQNRLNLPLPLSTAGSGAIIGAKMIEVSVHSYRKLAGKRDVAAAYTTLSPGNNFAMEAGTAREVEEDVVLQGGLAIPTVVGGSIGLERQETLETMAKAEKFRILITWHIDGTVRFHDASPHLLLLGGHGQGPGETQPTSVLGLPASLQSSPPFSVKAGQLEKAFPSPLPQLTIDIRTLVQNERHTGQPTFERLNGDLTRLQIAKVEFAPEALEVVIALRSGQVFLHKFGYARFSETEEIKEAVADEVLQDEESAADFAQLSPSTSQHSSQHRLSMSQLDGVMAGAMRDLDVGALSNSSSHASATGGPAPARPARDPKRLSIARLGGVAPQRGSRGQPGEGNVGEEMPSPPRASQQQHGYHNASQQAHQAAPRQYTSHTPQQYHSGLVEEVTTIGHLATWHSDGFKPNVLIDLQRGEVTTITTSDVGFVAIACGLALAVIDMRGPELIIREGFGDDEASHNRSSSHRDRKEERRIVEEENKSPIRLLKFSICRSESQPMLSPTLLAIRENGYITSWTLIKSSLDMWICERSYGGVMNELRRAILVEVLDKAGNLCPAVGGELQRSLREQGRGVQDWQQQLLHHPSDINILFGVGPRTLFLRVGLTGPLLAKVDVEEDIEGACVVDKFGEKICMTLSSTSIRLYTLPSLALITRVQRHNRNREERLSIQKVSLSFDGSGDFIEVMNSLDVRMWTIFATLPRAGPPSLLLYQPVSMPMAPTTFNNMANSVVNWIGGKSSAITTGAQFDEALAGNKRPPPPKLPEQKYIEVRVVELAIREREKAAAAAAASASASATGRGTVSGVGSSFETSSIAPSRFSADSLFARKKEERKDIVRETDQAASQGSWNIDLAKQRGEMMNSLEEGLTSLERGAKGWMQGAKEDFIKQAAKDRLSRYF